MRKFVGAIRTDHIGSECEFEFEVEDDATPEQIECKARQTAFDYVSWNYREVTATERQGGAE